ncbi:ribonuclease Y [Candidatus Uhrbacteria bacterium RIFCSPLOWO2_12_FULL_46_10]|uniref:Ribonuclease Y n=1 Tax=Candidatus Uhrbacteria bacterium RIFCSPLOWO2_01_FULL_47_25 TaxID=1802402 RepID=A0A1F7UVZ4_9BACT|nr:MAG: Ribonuclease Y [Parcubacteria group bacterium GW2011_GWA2_46_9]OGL58888.1 MAG: ribonuclease Y [Candidatus Uhrbacteria bacterium RIFCSPHIGHO2_01_FULL_46_23]OGL69412.1 MAG: ribonuclease Y [Candidatus Uhrbacteria bacterium RIFCSPHIGHO2_02_FULL_47_29]OGL76786.1 MAG: ribonuclease Y [Candidatus Uhrbacteria bacterium RIFCSPHIGHO2_12_FULL_46_13]OGL82426.1 MAG: ribonuclease Y [Candidatus Uhrbacteria bacterium RIFCSPLOWO2_01_FULL_47_25]OGL91486.1 MAG: ribonuclease Y [Candidatus Uhrbacteria bacte
MTIYFAVIGLVIGLGLGYLIRRMIAVRTINSAEERAHRIIQDAKTKEKELLLNAQQKSIILIEEVKREEVSRRQELKEEQQRLEKRETLFEKKLLELEDKQQSLNSRLAETEQAKQKFIELQSEALARIEKISGLSRDEARRELLTAVEEDAKDDILSRLKKVQDEGAIEVEEKAKRVLASVIQRCATSHAADVMSTTVDLPSDEMKGRIIGKEGRNIKSLEQLTGVEIIVDDTPQAITISGFSPVRRHLAKRALEKLMVDGRIQPTRIEEAVDEAKREMALEMKKNGEEAMYQLGVTGVDPKLVQILGRLKFRTSFGQNVLQHSIEVGTLSGLLAEELGADVVICKKGGLFHDIGKAVDHEIQGSHPELGYQMMKKYGLPEEVAYMSIAHHEDHPKTLEGVIVHTADAISASRPGARRDSLERYIQRLEELEKVATSLPGITKAYAIQAGREVRVFVTPTEVDDLGAVKLAQAVARKIEAELQYPGEIKVNVIRETRVVEYAR